VTPALARAGLTDRAGDKYRSYSLGMKQRLGIAAALLPDPELLILDEPTNGLDPAGIVEMRGLIRSFADDGMTVLVSSHLISEIEQICDYVVMIRAGQLVHQGSVADLRATQQRDLLAAPEHVADRERLAKILEARRVHGDPPARRIRRPRGDGGPQRRRPEPARRPQRHHAPPARRADQEPGAGVLRTDWNRRAGLRPGQEMGAIK